MARGGKRAVYSSAPLLAGSRDEHFLVEVPGIIVPDADMLYYGLLSSPIAYKFPKIIDRGLLTQEDIYYNLAFFDRLPMLLHLADVTSIEEFEECIGVDVDTALRYAKRFYKFKPCNITLMRSAILAASTLDYIKSITFVFDNQPTTADIEYFNQILPNKIKEKTLFAYGNTVQNVIDIRKEKGDRFEFTTIYTNSYDTANELTSHPDKYGTSTSIVVLRNHSGNTKCVFNEKDPDFPLFEERDDAKILERLALRAMGRGQMVFVRYEPNLLSKEKYHENRTSN